MRTAVVALGDPDRSLRMQWHAASLAAAGHDVDLVGLESAALGPAVAGHPRVTCHRLPDRAVAGNAAGQAWRLLRVLARLPKPDLILIQSPPASPMLAVAWLMSRLRKARLVIDWHNLAHTVAAVRLGESHRAVTALARRERRWARRADGHLAVSQALAGWLSSHFGVAAAVVYDRPAAAFHHTMPSAAAQMWTKLAAGAALPVHRPPLVVCPTSWTPDQDLDLLLEALERADRRLAADDGPVVLAVLLTGRGGLREAFEARVARRGFKAIAVTTHAVEPDDYPVLIGMAELGLCVHQSSSGLDLPMTVAGFRGAGVPVAAFEYAPVLGEVLTSGHEGVTFRDPGQLAAIFVAVATRAIEPESPLGRSQAWLFENPATYWDAEWQAAARPVLVPTPR